MTIIKETNKGEIKIVEHLGKRFVLSRCVVGFELAKKFGEKHGALIPNVYEIQKLIKV